ncbi:hypothetical protein RYX36_013901, partial [Vicia faba]
NVLEEALDGTITVRPLPIRTSVSGKEDCEKIEKVTSAGMYFLHFQGHKMDLTLSALEMEKDPAGAFIKRVEGFQPCEVSELEPGIHMFAVYEDNFFK